MAVEPRGERIPLLNRRDMGELMLGKLSWLEWCNIILIMTGLPFLVASAVCYYAFKSVPTRVPLNLLIIGSMCVLTALGIVVVKTCHRRYEFSLNLRGYFTQHETSKNGTTEKDYLASFEYETRPSDYYNLNTSDEMPQLPQSEEPSALRIVSLMQYFRQRLGFSWNLSRWFTEHKPKRNDLVSRKEAAEIGDDLFSDFEYETRPSDYYKLDGSDQTQSTESGESSVKNKTESEESSINGQIESQEIDHSTSAVLN